jgi:hypothetical protein
MFPIGVWFEGKPEWNGTPENIAGAKAYYDRCFSDIAANHMDCVAVPNCPEYLWETLLSSAEEHGLRVILEIPSLVKMISGDEPVHEQIVREEVHRIVDTIGHHTSLYRYQTRDEPTLQMLDKWALVGKVVDEIDPQRSVFSCFNIPFNLKKAREMYCPNEITFDIYPHWSEVAEQNLQNYIPLLDRFLSVAEKHTKWLILSSFAKPVWWRYPTKDELRCEIYVALASGIQGVLFFIYQSMPKHPENLEGLVSPEGKPTPIYSSVSQLAGELQQLKSILASAHPTDLSIRLENHITSRTFTESNGFEVFCSNVVKGDVRLGSFRSDKGNDILILASTRPGLSFDVRIETPDIGNWKDFITGEDFHPMEKGLTIPLTSGGRVLMR